MTIEIPHLTPEQLMAEIEDMMSESWVDPNELEEVIMEDPTLNSEVGFDQEFLRECD